MSSNKSIPTVVRADLDNDREEIVLLWKTGFPEKNNFVEKLDWFYTRNPSGKAHIFFLQKEGENIGVKGVGGKDWILNGCMIKAGLFSDLAVKKEYRTVGPALQLISGTVDSVSDEYQFLYGFPNTKSVVVYKRGGYKLLGRIGRYAKPLQYSSYIKERTKIIPELLGKLVDKIYSLYEVIRNLRLFNSYIIKEIDQVDEDFDKLWNIAKSKEYCMAVRDKRFLSWRFDASLSNSFKIFTVRSKVENELIGYVIYSIGLNNVAVVHDFFALSDNNHIVNLLKLFSQKMNNVGCKAISLQFFGDKKIVEGLKMAGFRLRESKPIVYRLTTKDVDIKTLNWFITSADRDT